MLWEVCYSQSTDGYPGQTNPLVRAKPDLSTREEREVGKGEKKPKLSKQKTKPKETKNPKQPTKTKQKS